MIRFDGQVALVTGGGRGMGREHCLLLARRGAKVVVNDLGVAMDGTPLSDDPSGEVVNMIGAEGGIAVSNHADISSPDGAAAAVQAAIEAFGTIDIVVHNAGIATFAPFGSVSYEQYRAMLAVHLDGGFLLAQAAWPHMVQRNYGRFVFITSQVALSGLANLAHYSVAKMGLVGLARALAVEGRDHGIAANALGVTALTRMMGGYFEKEPSASRPVNQGMSSSTEDWWRNYMRPELISPVVAWLVSKECSLNGAILDTAGGHTVMQTLATTVGHVDPALTPESVHEHLAEICDYDSAVLRTFPSADEFTAWRLRQLVASGLPEVPQL